MSATSGVPIIYLPGVHGDDSLAAGCRDRLGPGLRWVPTRYRVHPGGTLDRLVDEVLWQVRKAGVDHGWLLAESFGSQVAWALLARCRNDRAAGFRPLGLVLAGGFVRHPMPWAAGCLGRWGRRAPTPLVKAILEVYRAYGWVRFAGDRPALRGLTRFCRRRARPRDRETVADRLELIAEVDLRAAASAVTVPVHALAGCWDVIVPWPPVFRWLARHCPGWRGGRVLAAGGHAVLVERPATSARIVAEWVLGSSRGPGS